MVVLGGGAVSYERGTPVTQEGQLHVGGGAVSYERGTPVTQEGQARGRGRASTLFLMTEVPL